MFGLFRTMLAIWVMVFHLVDIPVIGNYAVFSFFLLSGFLMTTIMHDSYGYSHSGMKKYAINRFLRLYPMYWAVAFLSIVAIYFTSETYSLSFHEALSIPDNAEYISYNFTMVFASWFPWDLKPRLSPPTWALTLELFFYVCIGLGISKTKKRTLIWFGTSILFFIMSYLFDMYGGNRYSSISGASLPFSIGALAYFYKKEIFTSIEKFHIAKPSTILVVYVVNAIIFCVLSLNQPFAFSKYVLEIGKYFNLLFSLLVVVVLLYKGKNLMSKRVDKMIGDFSYPIYLCHWQCGLVVSFLLFDKPTKGLTLDGFIVLLLSFVFVFMVSLLLIYFVDHRLTKLRMNIKFGKGSEIASQEIKKNSI